MFLTMIFFLFLYVLLFSISLFFFSGYFFPTSTSTGDTGWGGTRPTQGATATRGGAGEGRRGQWVCLLFCPIIFFSSYLSSSFPIGSFAVEYNNMREGLGVPT